MDIQKVWRKLFSTFILLGLLNLILVFLFLYRSSVNLVEERAEQQLSSVNALASQHLKLYFDNLKTLILQKSMLPSLNEKKLQTVFKGALGQVYAEGYQGRSKVFGHLDLKGVDFTKYEEMKFYPFQDNYFLLKAPGKGRTLVWIFNDKGINEVLGSREGLGSTGEIYLVGEDQTIKSGSRHVQDWKNIVVNNASIDRAKEKKNGVHTVKDYRGVEVLSSYSDFSYDELRFVLLSEIDKEEVFRPLNTVFPKNLMLCFFIFLVTILVGMISSRKVISIVKDMRSRLNQFNLNIINALEEEKEHLSRSLSEILKQDNVPLKESLNEIVNDLQSQEMYSSGLFYTMKDHLAKEGEKHGVETAFWFNQRLSELDIRDDLKRNIYRLFQDILQGYFTAGRPDQLSLSISKEQKDMTMRFELVGKELSGLHVSQTVQYRVEIMNGRIEQSTGPQNVVFKAYLPLDFLSA